WVEAEHATTRRRAVGTDRVPCAEIHLAAPPPSAEVVRRGGRPPAAPIASATSMNGCFMPRRSARRRSHTPSIVRTTRGPQCAGRSSARPARACSISAPEPASSLPRWSRWVSKSLLDMAVAGPEIARVLAPGGILAGLWNVMDDGVEWVAGLARISGSAAIGPRDTPAGWRAETADMHRPRKGAAARFGSPEQAEFPHGQLRTADSLVATIATRAGMLVLPDQEQQATLGRIRAFLASDPETARGEFTLPMLTGVLRVRRL
ncbi:LOW QUALITY PROTEIN: conserved hypothetical protein, partial [Streptomyces himastatinicus ATCC 53653]